MVAGTSPGRTGLRLLALPGGVVLTSATGSGALRLLPGATAPGTDPALAVAGLAAALATVLSGWLTSCLTLVLLAEAPGTTGRLARHLRDRITPVVVRRWAAVVLGASATATVLPGTATAAVVQPVGDDTPAPGWSAGRTAPTDLSPGWGPTPSAPTPPGGRTSRIPAPGWTPHRPPPRPSPDAHLLTGRTHGVGADRSVVVGRGDTLWSIAAARLDAGATDEEIAQAWPHWYAANREVIGPDPHDLLPGTRLTPPDRMSPTS